MSTFIKSCLVGIDTGQFVGYSVSSLPGHADAPRYVLIATASIIDDDCIMNATGHTLPKHFDYSKFLVTA